MENIFEARSNPVNLTSSSWEPADYEWGAMRGDLPKMGTLVLPWIRLNGDDKYQATGMSRNSEGSFYGMAPMVPRRRLPVPVMGTKMKIDNIQRKSDKPSIGSTEDLALGATRTSSLTDLSTTKRNLKETPLSRAKRMLGFTRYRIAPRNFPSSDPNSPPIPDSVSEQQIEAAEMRERTENSVFAGAAAGISRTIADIKGTAVEKFESLVSLVSPSKTSPSQKGGSVRPRRNF